MKQHIQKDSIIIYADRKGNIELRADIEKDTLWATQDQIAQLFDTQRPAITKHLNNIFRTSELIRNSVCSILERTGSDGKKYKVQFFNLDAIIAVGYRVNSKKATMFRIWATGVLKQYLAAGYSLNPSRLTSSPERIEGLHEAVALIESTKHAGKVKGKIILKLTKEMEEVASREVPFQ